MLTFLRTDNWCALYIGNVKVHEDHSLTVQEFAKLAGVKLETRWFEGDEFRALFDDGYFPDKLHKDIPKPAPDSHDGMNGGEVLTHNWINDR
jgi:hypothetical protein